MHYIQAQKASDVSLTGINVELEHHGHSLSAVTFRHPDGGLVKVAIDSYNLKVLVPAPPKMVEKYRLSGKFAGLVDVCEDFDDEFDAKQRLQDYELKHSGGRSELGLGIAKVTVLESEQ